MSNGVLQAYCEYRSSGVEWMGDVPKEWEVLATARVTDLTTGDSDTQDAEEEGEYPFFVRSPTIEGSNKFLFDGEGVLTSGDGAGVGKIFHHHIGKFDFHQRVYLFHNFRRVTGRYFFYFLREHLHRVVLAGNAKSTVDSLRRPMLRMFPICLPSVDEQETIVEFLDYETAKIDALIEKQQQLIALLGEKRQAVISHAVTKGLNPDAPMRDSGVEWLGEVPEHWVPSKVGLLCSIISKGTTPRNGYSDKTEVPFIRVNNLSFTGDVSLQDLVYVSPLTHNTEISRSKVYAGDVLMNLVGPPLGKVGLVCDAFPEYNINQAVAFFRVVGVDPRFLCAWLQTSFARDWFLLRAKKTSGQANLTLDHCRSLPIALPERKEREAIVKELDTRLNTVDATIESSWDLVELLRERRTALISAAVTGKIDVRGWKPLSSRT